MGRKKKEIKLKSRASESGASSMLECYAERSLSNPQIMIRGTIMGQKRA